MTEAPKPIPYGKWIQRNEEQLEKEYQAEVHSMETQEQYNRRQYYDYRESFVLMYVHI